MVRLAVRGPAPRLRRLSGSASWGIIDQAASSLGSLLLSVAVARGSDLRSFGAFAAVFAAYALALTGSRALVSMPYLMATSGEAEPARRGVLATGTVSSALGVALALSVGSAAAAVLLEGPLRPYLVVLAIGFPALLLQDAYRYVLQQRLGIGGVAANDATWTLVQAVLTLLVALAAPVPTGPWYVAAWAGGAGVAAGSAWWRSRVAPHPVEGWRFLRGTHRKGLPLLVESFAISGSGQAAQFAVATAGGLAAVAPLRGAQVLLGPVSVVTGGLLFFVTPAILRGGATDRARLMRRCGLLGAAIAATSTAAALLVLIVPDRLGSMMLGAVWEQSRAVALPMGLAFAAGGIQTAAMLGFRAYQIATRTMVLWLAIFPLPAAAAVVGLQLGGSVGAAYGIAIAACVTAVILWVLLARLPADPPSDVHIGVQVTPVPGAGERPPV